MLGSPCPAELYMRGFSGPCYLQTAASQLYGVSYSISLLRLLLAKILTGNQHVPRSRVTGKYGDRGIRLLPHRRIKGVYGIDALGVAAYMVSLPLGPGKSSPTPIFILLIIFTDCFPAFKTGTFLLDAWEVPTTSRSMSSLLYFSIMLLNFCSIGTRTRCRVARLIISFLPTSTTTTSVGRAHPARGALGVPRPGKHQTRSRFLILFLQLPGRSYTGKGLAINFG